MDDNNRTEFEFYTENTDELVNDHFPIECINNESACYFEKLSAKPKDRIKYHEHLFDSLLHMSARCRAATLDLLDGYDDPDCDTMQTNVLECKQKEAMENLQLIVDTILEDFGAIDIIRNKSKELRENGKGFKEKIILKKFLRPIKKVKTNMADLTPKVDKEYLNADAISTEDYPTPMFIGDPNMPELRATNDPINCSSNISVSSNSPRFDEDVL